MSVEISLFNSHFLCISVTEGFSVFTILNAENYAPFFGFQPTDFGRLCKQFKVDEKDKKIAKAW
jgi:hypothetical protein